MPNHVKNIIQSTPKVISALLNAEGKPDFGLVVPYHEDLTLNNTNGFYGGAETAARLICGIELSDHPLLARIEAQNRAEINVLDFSNEGFEQFIMMVKNKRYHNYFHVMDFTRKMWGTKWNAYDFDELGSDETKIIFQTAWSNPKPVLIELSKKLPNEKIYVTYADEDIGSNCGSYIIKAGKVTEEKIRPKTEISQEEALSWVKFACEVWGLDYEEHLSEEYADEE